MGILVHHIFREVELNAAYLMHSLKKPIRFRQHVWQDGTSIMRNCRRWQEQGRIQLPFIPDYCEHNAHMFYIKHQRYGRAYRSYKLHETKDVLTVFHYVPLHSAPAGLGMADFTVRTSIRLKRVRDS